MSVGDDAENPEGTSDVDQELADMVSDDTDNDLLLDFIEHGDDTAEDAANDEADDTEEDEDMFLRRRIRRSSSGTFIINLPDDERELLHALPGQLHEMLTSGDPTGLRRLFPAAYHLDAEKDAEFHELMRSELIASKAGRAKILEETAFARSLTEEQLMGWMGAVNDLRLVLGTQLDVSEDNDDPEPDHPLAAHFGLYHYLGFLLENIVRAVS